MSKEDSFTTGQLTKIFGLARAKGLATEQVQENLLKNGVLADVFEAAARGPIDRSKLREGLGLPSLCDKFTELKDEKIFEFGESITIAGAIAEMDKQGYCMANVAELLNYEAKNPEAQRGKLIVEQNSSTRVNGLKSLVFRNWKGLLIEVRVNLESSRWFAGGRYLAVPKRK